MNSELSLGAIGLRVQPSDQAIAPDDREDMSIKARNGASLATMASIAEAAMKVWPRRASAFG